MALVAAMAGLAAGAAEKPLSIGWAGVSITPDRPVNIAGQMHMRPSQGVRDPVTATALALSTDDDGFVVVSLDLVGVSVQVTNGVRAKVAEKYPELAGGRVLLGATHTHTAPDITLRDDYPEILWKGLMTPSEYVPWLVDRIVDVVARAWDAREPGLVSWGSGYAVVSHGRRTRYFPDRFEPFQTDGFAIHHSARMYGPTNVPEFKNVEATADNTMQALFTYNPEGRLTGMLINLPAPSQIEEGERKISADFWHETRTALRGVYGDGLHVLAQCGAAGDHAPRPLYQKQAEERMLKLKGLSRREDVARRILAAILDCEPAARLDRRASVTLAHRHVTAELPRRLVTEVEKGEVEKALERIMARPASTAVDEIARINEDSINASVAARCRRVLARYDDQKANPTLPSEITALRIGDFALASTRFELYQEFGIRVQARSPAGLTAVVQLASDAHGRGTYLPTDHATEGGSYGATVYSNEIGHEGGDAWVEGALALLGGLFPAEGETK